VPGDYRIEVDVGGTFTDLICVSPDGSEVLDKTPTTIDDQPTRVLTGLGQLAEIVGTDLAGAHTSYERAPVG
jgi:N-methylhydantoinase A